MSSGKVCEGECPSRHVIWFDMTLLYDIASHDITPITSYHIIPWCTSCQCGSAFFFFWCNVQWNTKLLSVHSQNFGKCIHSGNSNLCQSREYYYQAEVPVLWPSDANSWLIGKDRDAGKDWEQEEKGVTEDEMVGWHHRLNGNEFEQALGDEGQGSLAFGSPRGHKDSDGTLWLNNNNTVPPGKFPHALSSSALPSKDNHASAFLLLCFGFVCCRI